MDFVVDGVEQQIVHSALVRPNAFVVSWKRCGGILAHKTFICGVSSHVRKISDWVSDRG